MAVRLFGGPARSVDRAVHEHQRHDFSFIASTSRSNDAADALLH